MGSEGPKRWLTAAEQRVWRAYLHATARLSDVLDADLRAHGLDLPEYEILVSLDEAPDRQLRMSELADTVHQSRSRLTHTIARMERQGLVERATCPTDRRGVWARLTDAGRDLLVAAAPHHVDQVLRHFIEPADPDDLAAMGRVYQAMLAAIDRTRSGTAADAEQTDQQPARPSGAES